MSKRFTEEELAAIQEAFLVVINWVERGQTELAAEQLRFLADYVENKAEGLSWKPFSKITC